MDKILIYKLTSKYVEDIKKDILTCAHLNSLQYAFYYYYLLKSEKKDKKL